MNRGPTTILALDNGAFPAFNQGEVVLVGDYTEFVQEHHDLFDVIFSCEVIGDPEQTYKNHLYMLRKGVDYVVPIFHAGSPIKYLYAYLDLSDYVAIGAVAHLDTEQRHLSLDRLWDVHLYDAYRMPKARFHGFWFTSLNLIKPFPWYSLDSSTWAQEAGRGRVFVPHRSSILVSVDSAHEDGHIDHLPPAIRNPALRYFADRGFRIGKGREGDTDHEEGLCNDRFQRYDFNLLHQAKIGAELGIKIFHAGNIETYGGDIDLERRMQGAVHRAGFDYYRLASFYYRKQVDTVMRLKEGVDERR
jgi:hypothetical protein